MSQCNNCGQFTLVFNLSKQNNIITNVTIRLEFGFGVSVVFNVLVVTP